MRKFYARIFTLFLFVFSAITAGAQLSGIKTIPGDYATIADAVTDLNAQGVGAGGVTFDVAAGHTETSDVPVITATGTAADPIVFQKSGAGANPLVTRATAGTIASSTTLGSNGDGIIIINGGDYITFDGIDLQTDATFSGNAMMEYGYFLKKASATDASKNVTISNSTITLNKTARYSFGIYVSNISGTTSVTVTAVSGASENIKIFGNTITNAYGGIQLRGYASASPYALYDQNIEVGVAGPNTITNFGGGASTAYGVYAIYQNNLKINNNQINGGAGTTTTMYGIFTSTGTNSNVDIIGNTIQLTSSATTSTIKGIDNSMGGSGTTNTVNVSNNIVENLTWTTATSGTFYGIDQGATAFNSNIFGNFVRNNTKPGTGTMYGIVNFNAGTNGFANTYNNQVYNNTNSGSATMYGVYVNTVSTANQDTYNNNVYTLSTAGGTIYGVYNTTGATNLIYKNKVYDLVNTGTTGNVYGLYNSSGANTTWFNNLVGGLETPNSTNTNAVAGLYISGGTAVNAYYNTIYVNATSSSATNFGTSGIYTSTTPAVELRNNIIVNTSTAVGTGLTAAYRRSSTTIGTHSASSNNNLYYAGTPSATNVIYTDGTNSDQTIGDFKTRVSPADVASFTEMPPFLSTIGASPSFLHIDPTVPTQVESGGAPITGITADYDTDVRNASTPDVGADEFAGIPADFTAPGITYSGIISSCDAGNRTFTADITDGSGVATGASAPRVYYSKNGGAWFSQAGTLTGGTVTNGTWTFTIVVADMGGLVAGDVVSYYVIAQDVNGNIASNPSGATATNVNTVTAPPPTPSTYTIQGPLTGTFNVGVGQTYTTLTAAVDAYNNSCLTGPVTFLLTDASYASETLPIVIAAHPDASAVNTLTIRPATGVTATISGSSASAVIKLDGADFVTIDGSNNGTTSRDLTIANTATTSNSAVIWIASQGTGAGAINNTIKNLNVMAGSNTATTFGIYAAGTTISSSGDGDDNDNLTIQNNSVSKAYYGIFAEASAAGVNDNLVVSGNSIGSATATDYIKFRGTMISYANNATIEKNTVFNIVHTATNIRAMEFGLGVTNTLVSKNVIRDIEYSATSFSGGKGMTFISGAGANITISNNMISGLKGHGSSTATNNSWAIMLLDGSGYNVWYNSINMPDNRSTTSSTDVQGGIYIASSVAGVDLRNNIISVTGMPGNLTSGRMYGIFSMVISPSSPFTVSDYNDIYVAPGTNHNVGYYHGSARATLADWQLATGQDANSLSVQPNFVSPTDLHLLINSNALLNGAATPIATVTTDIDDNTRDAVNPDMGADEFTPPPGADVGITALVSPATTGCYTATETVSVTLFNFSGTTIDFSVQPVTVNVTASGASVYASAVLLNSGTLASGSSMTVTMPTTFDMTPQGTYTFNANTVVAGDINSTNDAMTPVVINGIVMNGTFTVGVGGNFATLTDAVAAYNNSTCITGNVVFSLTDATYPSEIFPITISDNAVAGANTLTIRPAAGVNATISGNATAIIKLDGADNVIIDGSNSGTDSRNLTLENTSTSSSRAVVWVSSLGTGAGSTGNTIKNVNIIGGSSTVTSSYGIYAGGTSISTTGTGADNDNLTIENNAFSRAYTAIYASGTSTGLNDGLLILDNMIGSATVSEYLGKTGINVAYATGATIWGNEIFNLISSASGNPTGILVRTGFVSSTIERNNIHDLGYTGTSGYGGRGMDINTGSATSSLAIRNNMIANMFGDGWNSLTSDAIMGIRLTGTTGGLQLDHNTIHLSGSFAGHSSGTLSAGLFVNSSVTDLTLRNNIFSTTLDNTSLTTDKTYAIYSSAAASAFTQIDNNDYYAGGPAGVLGYIASTPQLTIADIQASFGGNAASVNIQPIFVSVSDAHLIPGVNFTLDNLGMPIPAIVTDIDGDARSATTPDMGADEFTSPTCTGAVGGTAVAGASVFCNSGSTTITATGYSSGAISTFQWQSSPDNTNWTDIAGENNPVQVMTGTITDTTYYRLRVTCNTGTATDYSNVVTVTVNPDPVVTITPTAAAICPGGSVVLTASGAADSYTWSPAAGLSATTGTSVTANPSVTTTYTVNGVITATGCTASNTVTVTVHPSVSATASAVSTTICNGQSTQLNANGVQDQNPIKITEVTNFRTGTGATSPYPAGMTGADLVEISNISSTAFDISGYTISAYGDNSATASHSLTFPASTVIPANSVAVVNLGTGTDNAGILYFNTGGSSDSYSSSSKIGVVVKSSGGIVVDAVGLGGSATGTYTFNAATGVTATDFSGSAPNGSGLAGSIRTVSLDNNAGSDWTASSSSNVQTIGSYNGGYVLPTGTFTYAWTPVTGLSDPAIANPMASPTADITYTVTATEVTTGCSATANVSITVNQLPAITSQPTDQTVCPGANVAFTVAATGTALTYQWKKDGVDLAGETAATLNLTGVTAANAGSYTVIVSGACAPAATSNAAVLTVMAVPVITAEPVAQTACVGTAASFTVTATGDGLTYQWRKGGVNIAGATAATFTIASVAPADADNYDVVITGTCGMATSVSVALTVDPAPAITSQPVSVTTCEGTSASFTVAASGPGLTYQWQKDGTDITGATSATLNIASVATADAGSYTVVVSGTCAPAVTSNAAVLTVNTSPVITTHPLTQTICAGTNVTFTVAATGTGLTYQWKKDGTDITGATASTFTITSAVVADGGNYTVVVSGTCAPSATSNVAVLTVDQAPVIGTQPASQTVCSGSNVTFTVAATGVGLTYQWYRNGTIAITGATSDTYTITGVTAGSAGQYHVVVNSSCGTTVTSSVATLTVNTPPAITVQPVSQTACLASTVNFTVTATGSALTYQWQKNGVDISGATSSTLTINNVSAADLGSYTVVVSGVCGTPVTSSAATLAVSATNTWLGVANSDWNNAANWCAGVPTSTSVILIPSGTPFSATLLGNGSVQDLTIASGATFTIGTGGALSVYGNIVNNGTVAASAGEIIFRGTTPQTIPALTVGHVVMNGTGGVTLGGTLTAVNAFTLTNGHITLGNNNLVMTGGSVGSVASHIITNGTGVVTGNNVGVASVVFPVGPDAASYNPVMVANGGGRNYSVRVATGINPAIFNAARAINRTWNVSVNIAPAAPASITFGYADAHANASATPSANMEVGRHNGTSWLVITPAGGVAPFGVASMRTVTTTSTAFGPMVVANSGGILNPTSLPNVDADITSAVLMPNVFEYSTILRMNVRRSMKIDWTIMDARGRVVMTFKRDVLAGQSDIKLMLGHLANGTYFLSGETEKGKTEVLRFIKL